MDWNEFLDDAVAEKDFDMVRQALAQGADPNRANTELDSAFFGTTVFYWAVSGGNLAIVQLLLDAGAQVAAEEYSEESSLHAAVEDANLPMVNLLLEHDGAVALDWFDYVNRTPLMIAVKMENISLVRRLVEAGADVNAHNEPKIGNTALRIAAENGTLEVVEVLLHAGADPCIEGWMRLTPLDKARGRKRGDGPRIYELLEQAAKRFLK